VDEGANGAYDSWDELPQTATISIAFGMNKI
jgi:hypothetical protein